jgi:hypothetical protein
MALAMRASQLETGGLEDSDDAAGGAVCRHGRLLPSVHDNAGLLARAAWGWRQPTLIGTLKAFIRIAGLGPHALPFCGSTARSRHQLQCLVDRGFQVLVFREIP